MRCRTFRCPPDAPWPAEVSAPGPVLVLVFADRHAGSAVAAANLRERFPQGILLGASTAGEISGLRVDTGGVVVAVIEPRHTPLRRAEAEVSAGARDAGRALGAALAAPDLAGVFVLCDGDSVNGSELVRGLAESLPASVPVAGGLAGDGADFGVTWTLDAEGRPCPGRVSAVGFYGNAVTVGIATRGGWDEFGPERRITRAEGNLLFELDGRPALELYKRYLGERAAGLPATALLFPLQVRADANDAPLVRTILSIDEAAQSLTFAGELPQGGLAKLMRANPERLIDGAASATPLHARGVPAFAILVSCVGRRLVLGERTDEEVEAVLANLPPGSEQIGFYSYGEIGPAGIGSCDAHALHNQSMTVFTVQEAER